MCNRWRCRRIGRAWAGRDNSLAIPVRPNLKSAGRLFESSDALPLLDRHTCPNCEFGIGSNARWAWCPRESRIRGIDFRESRNSPPASRRRGRMRGKKFREASAHASGEVSACVFLFGNLPASRLRLRGISWSLGRPSCAMQEGQVLLS